LREVCLLFEYHLVVCCDLQYLISHVKLCTVVYSDFMYELEELIALMDCLLIIFRLLAVITHFWA